MTIKEPENMDELVYFTNRQLSGGKGTVTAWTYKEKCPKCGKGIMGKPKDAKTGKVKIRATEYECPECKYSAPKEAYEDTLTCQAKYKCPKCSFEGDIEMPFIRKKKEVAAKAAEERPGTPITESGEKREEEKGVGEKGEGEKREDG